MGGVDRGEGKGGIGEEKSEGGKACVSAVAQNSYFGRLLERAVNSGGCGRQVPISSRKEAASPRLHRSPKSCAFEIERSRRHL
jgi:hypothetical protein